jgi:predicted transcriptional regulator
MDKEDIRDILLESMIESLEAQVRALKKLRGSNTEDNPRKKRLSQLNMVFDILNKANQPLHITEIIVEAEKLFGVKLERESLVSALTKKVIKEDQFTKTDKNTFALKEWY